VQLGGASIVAGGMVMVAVRTETEGLSSST
jgi:hypothetical protein